MKVPALVGVMERRLLVNYRVDPDVAVRHVPPPFRPQLVNGWAVAGICLIRLGQLRPRGLPSALGLRSENAAHRIAVEWDTPAGRATGVYIPRRDTAARLNVAAGGRLFPGEHHHARFRVSEAAGRAHVAFDGDDGTTGVDVTVDAVSTLSPSALFADLAEASSFFESSPHGYSATRCPGVFHGIALSTNAWQVTAAQVSAVRSSWFDDPDCFPPGSATLDAALLMHDVPVTWRGLAPIRAAEPSVVARLV
jgi:uncharacterized protein YqjF (DUF2071 family)